MQEQCANMFGPHRRCGHPWSGFRGFFNCVQWIAKWCCCIWRTSHVRACVEEGIAISAWQPCSGHCRYHWVHFRAACQLHVQADHARVWTTSCAIDKRCPEVRVGKTTSGCWCIHSIESSLSQVREDHSESRPTVQWCWCCNSVFRLGSYHQWSGVWVCCWWGCDQASWHSQTTCWIRPKERTTCRNSWWDRQSSWKPCWLQAPSSFWLWQWWRRWSWHPPCPEVHGLCCFSWRSRSCSACHPARHDAQGAVQTWVLWRGSMILFCSCFVIITLCLLLSLLLFCSFV